jgi:protein tyrosine phosphatase (PTP) superfamily phosphohydrolase (DUF442 family)
MRKAISEQVSVGEQPGQSDLEELKKDGVTTVVNLRLAPFEKRYHLSTILSMVPKSPS